MTFRHKNIFFKAICTTILLSLLMGIAAGCAPNFSVAGSPAIQDILAQANVGIQAAEYSVSASQDAKSSPSAPVIIPTLGEYDFDIWLDELFVDVVTSDSLTLNFFLADPSEFGIGEIEHTLGEVTTLESIHRGFEENMEFTEKLAQFDYNLLRPDQRLLLSILNRRMEIINSANGNEDFAFFTGHIRPLVGIQVQLPVLLAEFNFRTEADFEIYFALLQDTVRYFNEIIEFERERSRRGFFMTAENVDTVLEHIESFTENREDNFMILRFEDTVNNFEGLSEQRRRELMMRNSELVLDYFLRAYDNLAEAMRELRGVGAFVGGLASMPDGQLFAQRHLSLRVDSDRTIEEMDDMLRSRLSYVQRRFISLLYANSHLQDALFDGTLSENILPFLPEHSPEVYMQILRNATAQYFPPLYDINYVIQDVHESMQDHMSPAFFLLPAFDCFEDNVIYINPASLGDRMRLFTVLAHEGFPGHMYQAVYFLQQSPHPIRNFITGIGYVEGWATYAEMKSFSFAGMGIAGELLQLSAEFDLLFISIVDLGVNGFGWDMRELARFLGQMGITSRETIEEIFHMVIGIPLFYLPYSIGYLEMLELRDSAMAGLGEHFSLIEFHRFILEFGPSPFSLIHEGMPSWKYSLRAA